MNPAEASSKLLACQERFALAGGASALPRSADVSAAGGFGHGECHHECTEGLARGPEKLEEVDLKWIEGALLLENRLTDQEAFTLRGV